MSLGKGLGALITPTNGAQRTRHVFATGQTAHATSEKIWMVPVAEIEANPDQPRKQFNQTELEELAASIKEHGVLQPLLVAEKESGGYELIAGERRLRASKMAGSATVPVIVKKLADQAKVEVSIIENIQRSNLNPIEEAFAYKRLAEEFGLTQEAVAQKVGKSRPAVANAVRLLELPDEVQQAMLAGSISAGQGRALLSLPTKAAQVDMLELMLGKKISVRQVEAQVKQKNTGAPPERRDTALSYLERQLASALGTKVTIAERGGRGQIDIAFFSKQELAEIIKKITG